MQPKPVFKTTKGRDAILKTYDQILARWPVPCESLWLPTALGQTHVIACGDPSNPPLVLLHGSTSNALMWIGDVANFSQRYRVYAVDLLGEPGRSEAVRPDLKGNGYVDWLREVFDLLGIEKTELVGISLGGFLALQFAAAVPERIQKLVVLCPAGVANQKLSFMLSALFLMPFGEVGRKRLSKLINGDQPIAQEAIDYIKLISDNFNPRVEMIPLLEDEALKRIDLPVLLIAGEKDALLPSRQTADRLKRILPNVEILLLPDAGHTLLGFDQQIMSFLSA